MTRILGGILFVGVMSGYLGWSEHIVSNVFWWSCGDVVELSGIMGFDLDTSWLIKPWRDK